VRLSLSIYVFLVVAAFLLLHTGSRAAALCERDGSALADGLSLWPPGTRCSGGEPVVTVTRFDVTVVLLVPAAALLVFGAAALREATRASRDGGDPLRRRRER
jgi:hypothetical protein